MLVNLLNLDACTINIIGILFSFLGTFVLLNVLKDKLPKDGGRAFAHDGALSQGKPRGAGIIFVLVFAVASFLFIPFKTEYAIYIVMIIIAMFTGFFDDAAKKPWGEFKKGMLDLVVAALVALTLLKYDSSVVNLALFNIKFSMNPILFAILVVALLWGSINVTNCTDGVDGLSASLTIVSALTLFVIGMIINPGEEFLGTAVLFAICLLAYLWFNSTPSLMLMGDAGSRAMGLFLGILALKTGAPFIYIPVCLVIILDGGLGLLKLTLIRLTHNKGIMSNIRTPLHDHFRKNLSWSNTQCVNRFVIVQIIINICIILGVCLYV